MTRSIAAAAGLALSLAFAGPALANGATAEFQAGGVVFKHNKDISIVREDLEIGLERIRVHYVFHSAARRPVRLTIGFPMAKIFFDDGPDELGSRSASKNDLHDYMAFVVFANGRRPKTKLHEYAWLSGVNVTRELRAMHVPVFAVFNGKDFGLQHLKKPVLARLLEKKLVDQEGGDRTIYPQWEYQSVYEWRQTFAPGKNEVEVTYTPLAGDETTEEKYSMFPGDGDAKYCYDDAFKAGFKQWRDKNSYTEPVTVGYILKTATNWNGPIDEFHLKVTAPEMDLFSFCTPDGLKPTGDGVTWEAKNFVPRQNLEFVFYKFFKQ